MDETYNASIYRQAPVEPTTQGNLPSITEWEKQGYTSEEQMKNDLHWQGVTQEKGLGRGYARGEERRSGFLGLGKKRVGVWAEGQFFKNEAEKKAGIDMYNDTPEQIAFKLRKAGYNPQDYWREKARSTREVGTRENVTDRRYYDALNQWEKLAKVSGVKSLSDEEKQSRDWQKKILSDDYKGDIDYSSIGYSKDQHKKDMVNFFKSMKKERDTIQKYSKYGDELKSDLDKYKGKNLQEVLKSERKFKGSTRGISKDAPKYEGKKRVSMNKIVKSNRMP